MSELITSMGDLGLLNPYGEGLDDPKTYYPMIDDVYRMQGYQVFSAYLKTKFIEEGRTITATVSDLDDFPREDYKPSEILVRAITERVGYYPRTIKCEIKENGKETKDEVSEIEAQIGKLLTKISSKSNWIEVEKGMLILSINYDKETKKIKFDKRYPQEMDIDVDDFGELQKVVFARMETRPKLEILTDTLSPSISSKNELVPVQEYFTKDSWVYMVNNEVVKEVKHDLGFIPVIMIKLDDLKNQPVYGKFRGEDFFYEIFYLEFLETILNSHVIEMQTPAYQSTSDELKTYLKRGLGSTADKPKYKLVVKRGSIFFVGEKGKIEPLPKDFSTELIENEITLARSKIFQLYNLPEPNDARRKKDGDANNSFLRTLYNKLILEFKEDIIPTIQESFQEVTVMLHKILTGKSIVAEDVDIIINKEYFPLDELEFSERLISLQTAGFTMEQAMIHLGVTEKRRNEILEAKKKEEEEAYKKELERQEDMMIGQETPLDDKDAENDKKIEEDSKA